MRNCLRVFVAVSLFCVLSLTMGCTIAKISGSGEVPLILNQPQAKVTTIEKFEHSKHIAFDYTSAFDVSEVLDEVMINTNADAIINIKITLKETVGDFFLDLITLGLAQSRHFIVSGTAIKAPEGLSFLQDNQVETLADSMQGQDFMTYMFQDAPGKGLAIVRNRNAEDCSFQLVRYTE